MSVIKLKDRCPEMMALLRHTEDSVYFKDMDGKFVLVSEAKASRSGVRYEDMIGKTDFDFLPLEEAQECRNDEILIMKTGESIIDKEEELTRPDGTKDWVSVSKIPWRDADGTIIGVIGISRVVTKMKKMEKHILQMLSIATHDMRSPIVSMGFTLKLLAKGRFGEVCESVQKTLLDVFDRMIRLEKIVGEYLAKSSLMSSDKVGEKVKLDLRGDIIDPILEEVSREIEEKGIRIDNRLGGIPGNKLFVSANKTWLKIVYRNLFSNAIRHTPEGGVIAYGFKTESNGYQLSVFNSGPPVPPEKKECIFDMFESETNSGIGLPVIRELVRRHGGDMWCEETPDGHPNFIFTLPKEEETA